MTDKNAQKEPKHARGVAMLESFGLTRNEALIYTYLLERGVEAGASKIALGTRLHRQYVYLAMEQLLMLGLVEALPHGKQKRYKAAAPGQIEKISQRKAVEAEDIVRELNTFSAIGNEQDFEVLQGTAAIQHYEMRYAERAEDGDEEYIIGGDAKGFEEAMGDVLDEYTEIKDRKHMHVLYVGGDSVETKRYEAQASFSARMLPGFPQGQTHMVIRRDSVVFFSFLKPPLAYVIKLPTVAADYKRFFMMLWNTAKPN